MPIKVNRQGFDVAPLGDARTEQIAANLSNYYREVLAGELGQQSYNADRDYYKVLGYRRNISVNDYLNRYERGDVAARIVDLPSQDTWRKPPPISDGGRKDSDFLVAWNQIVKRLKVWSALARADRLCGIGRFGVLLLGIAGGTLDTPLRPATAEERGPESLAYLRPLSEANVDIVLPLNNDDRSPRYGMPEYYNVTLQSGAGDGRTIRVHYSRVLHIADNKMDNEIYGVPRLKKVWNRLDDLQKLTGGSAEATWLNMRRGTVFTTREGHKLDGDAEAVSDRQDMIRRYVHDMARILMLEGLEVQDLGSSTVDPRGAFEVVISQISAATNIPQRVLIGSAQGELAAAEQDTKIWYDYIASRQVTWAEPEVLRPFIDRLIKYGVLPAPASGEYEVGIEDDAGERAWPSLWQVSKVEAAAISMNKGQSVAAMRDPVTGYIPITDGEMRTILGFPEDGAPTPEVPEAPEEEPLMEPPEEFPEEELPETGPDETEPEPARNLKTAVDNYRNGDISARQLARFAALEWGRKDARSA